jgi:hypothetical protein
MDAEFTIDRAAPPVSYKGGRAAKSVLRQKIEARQPGQVLRWRGEGVGKPKMDAAARNVRREFTEREFVTRKVNGGFDIYRTA